MIIEMDNTTRMKIGPDQLFLSLSLNYLNLTHIERKIADLVKNGHTTREISELLKLSPIMIHYHRKNIRKKLDINDSVDLVCFPK